MHTDDNHSQSQWHPGEETMHRLLQVPYEDNPTVPGLPAAYGLWMTRSPLLALGTVDNDDRVWTTVLGGSPGVARPIAAGVLGLNSPAHLTSLIADDRAGRSCTDPVLEALFHRDNETPATDGKAVVRHDGRGKLVSGLVMDLEHRTRVKIAGRMLQGVVTAEQPDTAATFADQTRVDVQMAVAIDETLGNCPKYLNKRVIRSHEASPQLIGDSLPLLPAALDIIAKSDTFFISSRDGAESMDTNNRGGAPGFVRIIGNSEEEGVTLVYPEYSGNRLYQTLGNITSDPAVGVTFPDFDTGNVLYLAGRAEVLIGDDATSLLPHSKVAVRITVEAARLVADGLSFRGSLLEPSPYNPPVRRLAREISSSAAQLIKSGSTERSASGVLASLIERHLITPTISRYTFRLSSNESSLREDDGSPKLGRWRAGQHVTLDFSAQLDRGWSHMRDHDPSSLNDDYIRSFTISSAPHRFQALSDNEFEITVRELGPVTRLLARWKPGSNLTVPVLGFGGEDDVRYADEVQKPDTDDIVVVASGVGITPFMAQALPACESGLRLTLLWSVRADDLAFAVDVIERVVGLGLVTKLFVSGTIDTEHDVHLRNLVRLGAEINIRRIEKSDVRAVGTADHREFYVCAVPPLHAAVLEWVAGEHVRFESYRY